jgi:AMMECR1 domain-containing protein
MPVRADELDDIHIEISRLTPPQPLAYDDPAQLPGLLHPHEDGVILRDGQRRATFLPQVWDKIPDPQDFLTHLCPKWARGELVRHKKLDVEIYHVEEFHEAD